jgi:hypothetical protein
VRGRHVKGQLLDESRQAGRLSLRQVEHEPRQGRGVDDRVLERAFEASADEPRVERIMAVLDENSSLSEPQEGPARISELRCPNEHRAVDVMAAVRVRVDRRLAVHQRVEEGERAVQPETFGADLQHQERSVTGGFDVEGDELRLPEPCPGFELWGVDGDLLPGHRLHRPTRLEVDELGAHRVNARARRAQPISSLVNPRNRSTAPP